MQIDGRDKTARRYAQNARARAKRDVAVAQRAFARGKCDMLLADGRLARQLHDQPRRAEADRQAQKRLDDLADGGGGHVALPLEEAAIGRDHADQQHARRKRRDGRPGVFVGCDHDRKRTAQQQHAEASGDADDEKDEAGAGIDFADLCVIAQRLRL